MVRTGVNVSNQVLALKYRPRRFEDLIGQDSISTTLSLALDSNRLSHAYLFSGLRGSGKTSTARIMAKALVCENAPTSKPCDKCDGCITANDYRHMDIIEMDAASNRGIDDIKDLIEHTKYKPTNALYKVFIIDEVHMLTTQAFNALLKTLEEPPSFVKFILATTDPLKLPATILSRTQHFRFKKISDQNILHHLTHILNLENVTYEEDALKILIRSGQGSLRDTLTLLDQAIIYSKGSIKTSAITDMMGMIDPAFMDRMFETIVQSNDLNPILVELDAYEPGQVIDEISIYLKQKMLLKDLRFDVYMFDRFFRILGDAKQLLSLNSDGGFVMILTLAKLAEATKLKTIDDIIAQVESTPTQELKNTEVRQTQKNIIPNETEQIVSTYKIEVNKEQIQNNEQQSEPKIQDNKPIQMIQEEVLHENIQAHAQNDFQNNDDLHEKYLDMYAEVEGLIFDRQYELGECFAQSFLFSSYENNILTIDSCAHNECRQLLHKNFAYIRGYIEDIFGKNTEIKFNKLPPKELPQSDNVESDTGSMIEEQIQGGSGCVATMGNISNPNPAQQEMTINDVLNSKMIQKSIELFQPETQIRVKSKL